ncbi:MAG: hypothetical protein PHY12_05785 [Eubacteriales bacterium]|nr:hypothetical protein [Eubacteriales bacterium]
MNCLSTGFHDELGTPIYEGDTVMIFDKTEGAYLGVVTFQPDLGGWVVKLTACETRFSGTGWMSMEGFAVTQWRTLRQYKRRFGRTLQNVRLSVRASNALVSLTHLAHAQTYARV